MSYLLHVWEVPRLLNYPEAAQTVSDLGSDVLGPNLRFQVLAEWLNARYPCNPLEPGGVWSNGPPDGRTEKRVLVLDICDKHQEVIAYIVHCASRLELSVFDMQSETAWQPTGGRLRPYVPPAVPAAPRVSMREPLDDIRVAIHEGLMRVLGKLGFVYDMAGEGELLLRFPGGFHRIGVPVWNYYPLDYSFSFHLETRLDEVVAITMPFKGTTPEYFDRAACSLIGYGYLYGEERKKYEIVSREGLAAALTEMNIVVVNKLLPLLDSISDIHGLEALFNGPPTDPPFQLHPDKGFNALTLARLAGNPDYPALCAHYLRQVHPGNRELRRNLPRLIAYLDNYDADNPTPPPPFPRDEAARFIADYDGSQFDEFDVRWVGTAGQECFDLNQRFRVELIHKGGPGMLDLPLRLLRDLCRAEAKACTTIDDFKLPRVGHLFCCLLSRGGVGELALFRECVPLPWLSQEKMKELPFAPDMAESLRHACEKCANNPGFGERREQYAALEKYFAAFAARRHA